MGLEAFVSRDERRNLVSGRGGGILGVCVCVCVGGGGGMEGGRVCVYACVRFDPDNV